MSLHLHWLFKRTHMQFLILKTSGISFYFVIRFAYKYFYLIVSVKGGSRKEREKSFWMRFQVQFCAKTGPFQGWRRAFNKDMKCLYHDQHAPLLFGLNEANNIYIWGKARSKHFEWTLHLTFCSLIFISIQSYLGSSFLVFEITVKNGHC